MKRLIIVIGILMLLSFIGFIIFSQLIGTCTLEAKICQDGSVVGRSGLFCKMESCPVVPFAKLPIHVTSPSPNSVVKSPLSIVGEAKGTWYLNGNFSFSIIDDNGAILANGIIQAKKSQTTGSFIPFESSVTFTAPTTKTGIIILSSTNSWGPEENNSRTVIPVKF